MSNKTSSEDAQQQSKLFFLKLGTPPAQLSNVKETLNKEKRYPIIECEGIPDLEARIKQGETGVAIICISNKKQLVEALHFLKGFRKEVKDRFLIPAVFLQSNDPKEEELLLKVGCGEVQRYSLNERAILHKINRYFMLIQPRRQVEESDLTHINSTREPVSATGPSVISLNSAVKEVHSVAVENTKVEVFPALIGDWDYWLVLKKTHARKIKESWIVEVIGPAPSEGKWERADGGSAVDTEETQWIWKSRKEEGAFYSSYGTWVFYGRRPVYSWVINRWAFVSSAPDLSFYEDGNIAVDYRFKVKTPTHLQLRKNSENAIALFPKIKATFDLDYAYKEEEGNVPWHDRINTNDLKDIDWNFHDQDEDETDWNNKLSDYQEIKFKMGAEAMEACGIEAAIEEHLVNLMGYEDEGFTTRVYFSMPYHDKRDEYSIDLTAHNLEIPSRCSVKGRVERWQFDPASNEVHVSMIVDDQFNKYIKNVRKAVEKRQEEIFAFFNKAKGLG